MDKAYTNWIQELKHKIKIAQLKASIAVNQEMILLYWDIGKSIVEKQNEFAWGSKVVEQMAKDLKTNFPIPMVFPGPICLPCASFICFI